MWTWRQPSTRQGTKPETDPFLTALGGANPANTLFLELYRLELWDNEFLLFKTLSLWYFVMAALVH